MNERAKSGLWAVGAVLGALWLVLLGLLVAGYVAGAQPTSDAGPEIDHSEPPNEVAVDALRRLRTRDYTAELWVFEHNRTLGTTSGGIVHRIHLQHSERRYRMISWGTTTFTTESGVITPDQSPDYAVFGNDNFYIWQRNPKTKSWERRRRGSRYADMNGGGLGDTNEAFADAPGTVLADNESVLVVRVTNPDALARVDHGFSRYKHNASVTVVVTKGANSHVERITFRNRTLGVEETTHIDDVGTATAPRPEPAPPVTVTETVVRITRGLRELFG